MARSRFHSLLLSKVEQRIADYRMSLADGAAVDYPAYKYSVGYIQGMLDCMKLADEIEGEPEE